MTKGKAFNVNGPCVPEIHYMVDTGAKIDEIIREYIKPGKYFAINRARQYGKTTTLELLYQRLRDKYVVIDLSFEGREDYFESRYALATGMLGAIARLIAAQYADIASELRAPVDALLPFDCLDTRLSDLCARAGKPVILTIDEVDKAANNDVFIALLGLLRDKYIERIKRGTPTFLSVILAGVHDIKNLKLKLRPDENHNYNSPWNIAARFDVDMSFSAPEIKTMLDAYEHDTHTRMDTACISERIFEYTGGYPYLVSLICKTIDEDLYCDWSAAGVNDAVKYILYHSREFSLLEDLQKNIERHADFKALLIQILVDGIPVSYNGLSPAIDMGVMYGVLMPKDGKAQITNRIFESFIYTYLISISKSRALVEEYISRGTYVMNGKLNMALVLNRFAAFLRSEYRHEDGMFIEREGRLLFLSFLKPIINGAGHYVVEPETRLSRRMDVVVFYGGEEHIVELKIWRGERAAQNAYDQLAGYIKSRGQTRGFLLSFCDNITSPREGGEVRHDGCEITEVIVAYRDNL